MHPDTLVLLARVALEQLNAGLVLLFKNIGLSLGFVKPLLSIYLEYVIE